MKIILALTLAVLAAPSAFAAPAKPVRMVRVEGTIMKAKVSYSPLEMKNEKVCDFSGTAPVYAPLNGRDSAASINLGECDTDIFGEKVKVDASVLVMLDSAVEPGGIQKTATATLTLYKKGKDPIFTSGSAGVDDPLVKNIRVFLTSQVFKASTKERSEETFSVSTTFKEMN